MDLKPLVSGPLANLACGSKRGVLCTGCVATSRCRCMGSEHTHVCILEGAKLRSFPSVMLKMLPQFSLFSETLRTIAYGFHLSGGNSGHSAPTTTVRTATQSFGVPWRSRC